MSFKELPIPCFYYVEALQFYIVTPDYIDYDPLLMGSEDMCDCRGVLGAGCIEGEGDCDTDDQCLQVTSDVT